MLAGAGIDALNPQRQMRFAHGGRDRRIEGPSRRAGSLRGRCSSNVPASPWPA